MKWQPTPVSLPGKSHGRRNLVGPSSWGPKELDMTEQLHFHLQKGPAAGTAEMNSKHYWLSRSQFQRSIFSHPLGKEIKKKKKKEPRPPQDKMHSELLPEWCWSKRQEMKSCQNGHLNCLQTVHEEESWEMVDPTPIMFPGNRHWQQPLEGTACTGQNQESQQS